MCNNSGPALAVDTACSSSLTAMQLTADLLRRRACTRGLVAAALLTLEPSTVGALAAAAMLAPDGRCKTLDAGADGHAPRQALKFGVLSGTRCCCWHCMPGVVDDHLADVSCHEPQRVNVRALGNRYGRGEACVTLGLSLRESGDLSRGQLVLLGSAVNQDGRSSSLTAPHGPSQQQVCCNGFQPCEGLITLSRISSNPTHQTLDQNPGAAQVMHAAMADACTPAEAVQCMELHGTGTPLGDPIEVGAVAAVLAGTRATAVPMMLGAAKSHLGHAEPAAGSSAVVRSAAR